MLCVGWHELLSSLVVMIARPARVRCASAEMASIELDFDAVDITDPYHARGVNGVLDHS